MSARLPKVLLCHNFYQNRAKQLGGEDVVFFAERDLLRQHGHEVIEFTENNERINGMNRLKLVGTTIWSRDAHRTLGDLVRQTGADIVHFHNTFPLLSPAVYSACKQAGAAVVQTLHNYRLMCPNGLLFRDGAPCEDCVGRTPPLPGVIHGCYGGSRAQTAVIAAMLTTHRLRGTWREDVDVYIALTEFSRQKLIDGGLPAAKIAVKPNFLDPAPECGPAGGDFFLFAGRLSPDKGVGTLLDAWSEQHPPAPLRIAGGGQMLVDVGQAASASTMVEQLGPLDRPDLIEQMRQARMLIFPSQVYENFPVTLAEAFACGLPVIASRVGAMAEIVDDGRTGLHFNPGDPDDLRQKVRWAWEHPDEIDRMAAEARREYETKYTGEENYQQLIAIYDRARAVSAREA